MKRASELAVSDPYDGQSTLDEAEVFRIASEVGLPVAAALAFGGLSAVVIAAATARVIGRLPCPGADDVSHGELPPHASSSAGRSAFRRSGASGVRSRDPTAAPYA